MAKKILWITVGGKMAINFNGQNTIINSQIGDHNTYYNNSLTENDWENLEKIIDQLLKELSDNSDLCCFFNKSKKYASTKNEAGLKDHFKKNCTEFIKNVLYNMASTGIIALLSKIGIII